MEIAYDLDSMIAPKNLSHGRTSRFGVCVLRAQVRRTLGNGDEGEGLLWQLQKVGLRSDARFTTALLLYTSIGSR